MRILVTGINGQLGYDVVKALKERGHEPIGTDRETLDITDEKRVIEYIREVNPDGIIHCAAYTAVDDAEDNEELCRQVNAYGTKYVAQMAKELDIPMIYISTDYVFDGTKDGEYTEEDIPNPINVYGQTKLEGEQYVQELLDKYYIVRISWVFGENGNNFVDTMLKLANERDSLSVICDQVGSPTYTKDLAPLLIDMIECDKYGIYHASNEGFCSWYEFAKEIFNIANVDIEVNSICTNEYPTKANRPVNSKMCKYKLYSNINKINTWQHAIKRYMNKN